ncbi:heat shock protein homolog [Hydra vulgaris]|uniref:Heat shock protein homolog n=1 Tax=Hydra vulgaris TaxID=6087 RepID=A0ABM4CFW6_HYDVU
MAAWQIPAYDANNIEVTEDPFDEFQECTFPPLRYLPLFYERKSPDNEASNPRRESTKERDRLYKELVGHEPYISHHKEDSATKDFRVKLDVRHYKPEEVTVKVEGHTIEIKGKHQSEKEYGFDSCEFYRKYPIPSSINPHSLVSKITQDGMLYIQVLKDIDPQQVLEQNETRKKSFKYSLDVDGYKPDEIKIRIDGQNLFIHGESKAEGTNEHGVHTHQKQFTRQISLPVGLDPSQLSSRYTNDFKLTIEAPLLGK